MKKIKIESGSFAALVRSYKKSLNMLAVLQHICCLLYTSGRHRRRRSDLCTESLHNAAAVRLLFVADLYLINGGFETENLGSVRKGGSPLARTGFGSNVRDAFFFAIICLSQRRVQFMRTDRADTCLLYTSSPF